MPKSAHFALTIAAFLCGVAVGARLRQARAEPVRRSYDREAEAVARAQQERAAGLRWRVDMMRREATQGGAGNGSAST